MQKETCINCKGEIKTFNYCLKLVNAEEYTCEKNEKKSNYNGSLLY